MYLAQRAYVLILLTAVVAIAGIWSDQAAFRGLWRLPAALLLLGLAWESFVVRRTAIVADVETAPRAFLGRKQAAAFTFRNDSGRAVAIEFAPVLPDGFDPLTQIRKVVAAANGVSRDAFMLAPVRLGVQTWKALPARLLGPLGLAWWSQGVASLQSGFDCSGHLGLGGRRSPTEILRVRVHAGLSAGPAPSCISCARIGMATRWPELTGRQRLGRVSLVTRELSEDQHLDILIAIDAGRFSRVRAGDLDRLGLYANVAARFAEIATPNDDRVGLMVFSDRPLVACAPARGLAAVMRIRQALEGLRVAAGRVGSHGRRG